MRLNVREVRIAMLDQKLTNASLARIVKVHPATIAKWLNNPSLPQLEDITKLAQALSINENIIIDYE